MTTYRTKMYGDEFKISADFADASCPVHGDSQGRQVADFRHNSRAAMRAQLEEYVAAGGDDPADCEDDIVAALNAITETE